MTHIENTTDHPYLATVAVRRRGTVGELPGRYCAHLDVWVIDGESGPTPIVWSGKAESAAPLTKVKGERDEFYGSAILELATKTHAQMERDDLDPRTIAMLLELITKTETVRERDDPSPKVLLELATETQIVPARDGLSPRLFLELVTKTATVPERDDR
jgi:hypothetical protein